MRMILMNYLDIFSIPIQLNYKNEQFFKSKIGFATSLAIFAMISSIAIILMKDLFEHTGAIVVSKMQFSVNPRDFQLTAENFQVALILQDKFNGIIQNTPNQTYYNLVVDFIWLKQESVNGTIKPTLVINKGIVRQCTLDDATYGMDPIFITKFYCLDKKTFENQSLALGGDNSQDHVRFVRVQVRKCIHSPECAPYDQVEAKLAGAKVNLAFSDFFLDSTSYNKPLQKFMRVKQFGIDSDLLTRSLMWMRRISVQSDENFFLFNNKRNIEEGLQFQTYENNYNQQVNNSQSMPAIREFMFEIEQSEEYTYRSYGNILEVMAYIGGFYRFLTFIASLFINPWVKKHYTNNLLTEVNQNYDQREKILSSYAAQPKSPQIEKEEKNRVMEKLKFFSKQSKLALFAKQHDIMKCMDVMRIIQISQDIQRLKSILLTKEQKVLFDLIPVGLNFENDETINDFVIGDSIKFVQNQDNFINFNIKQCLFKDIIESPSNIDYPEFEKKYSIIPDEIKSSRDLQDYQIVIKSKFPEIKQYKT